MSTTRTAVPRYRGYSGPAILKAGFRPFFLAAGLWSAAALALWLMVFLGGLWLPTAFPPVAWHVHEMLYGFVVAAVAGFLLTAIPNWTGRMPLQGVPLLALVLLWLAGRCAVAVSEHIGAAPAAGIDLAFLAVFLAVVLREIVAGRNWRNLPMAGALSLLLLGNALMHAEAAGWDVGPGAGWRLGLAVMVMLITLIGGRIVPSFTRNWLAKHGSVALPAAFGVVDKAALASTAVALLCWIAAPEGPVAGALLGLAAAAQALRLSRWCGHRTGAEPLLWVLHLGYAWVPVGLAVLAAAALSLVPETAALHALTAGAIGTMTLAVMSRATLGHTGNPLQAGPATTAVYLLATAAALARVAAVLLPSAPLWLLTASGLAWIAAFLGFALLYGRLLVR